MEKFEALLEFWNEEAFKSLKNDFQKIELHEHKHHGKVYRRIHFILDEDRYLNAELNIGYPFVPNQDLHVFMDIGIYEDNGWTSYFDGALFPNYLKKAKLIQRQMEEVFELIKNKIKEEEWESEIKAEDFSKEKIAEIEGMSKQKRKNDLYLYTKYKKRHRN